eukprot:3568448-Prymnesium_polylepis.1
MSCGERVQQERAAHGAAPVSRSVYPESERLAEAAGADPRAPPDPTPQLRLMNRSHLRLHRTGVFGARGAGRGSGYALRLYVKARSAQVRCPA